MGEEIEVTDVNGNVVMVPWHALLERIATHVRGREPVMTSTSVPGEWLRIELESDA